MIDLSAESFHPVAQKVQRLACVLYRGRWGAAEEAVSGLEESLEGPAPVLTRLDLDAAPEIARSFGLTEATESHLLLMKERVVLYLEPLTKHEPQETAALLKRAMTVDMDAVRRTLAETRSAQSHLFARRVCPTAHRGNNRD
jgi:hypothetical protein